MNALIWFLVGVATAWGTGFAALTWLDVWYKKQNEATISSKLNALSESKTWVLLMVAFILGSVWGALLWHFVSLEGL